MLCAVDPVVCLNFIGFVVQIVSIIGCHRIYDSKGRKGGAFVGFLLGPLGFVLACLVKPVKGDPRLNGLRVKKAIKQPIVPFVLIGVAIVVIIVFFFLLATRNLDNKSLLVPLFYAGISLLAAGFVCWGVAVARQTSRRRADAGNAQCQYNVAVAILNGEGNVFKTLDTSLAIGYLKRSAEQGYQPAIAAFEEIREHGVDVGFVAHARVCNAPINPETGASLTEDELEKRRADGHPVDRCRQGLTDEDVFCPACGAKTSPSKDPMALVDPMVQVVVPRNKAVPFGVWIGYFLLLGLGWYFNYQREKSQNEWIDTMLRINDNIRSKYLNAVKDDTWIQSTVDRSNRETQTQIQQREWAEKATEIMGFKVTQTEVEALSHSELRKVLEALVRCENAFQKIDEEIQEYYREQQHGSSRYTDYLDGLEASLKELDQAIESFLATTASVSHGWMTGTQTPNRLEQGLIDVARSELKQVGVAACICRKNLESDLATDSSVTAEILADPDYNAAMTDESRQTFLPNWKKVCETVGYNPITAE